MPRKKSKAQQEVVLPVTDELLQGIAGPVAWGYGRVSHRSSLDSDSLQSQESRCKAYWKFHLEPKGIPFISFLPEPRDVSAYRFRFADRPIGKYLMSTLRRGDHLIVDKIDRLWRSIHDFSSLLQFFQSQGVIVHFVNLMGATVELGTPMGDFMVGMMVLAAQLESAVKSDRIKAMLRHAEDQGLWRRKYRPPGCRIVGSGKTRRLAWDWQERKLLAEIVRLRTQERLSGVAISDIIDAKVCEAEGRPFFKLKKYWTPERCVYGYICELHYRLVTKPSDVPWRKIAKMRLSEADKIAVQLGLMPAEIDEEDIIAERVWQQLSKKNNSVSV
jgi:DNA invertase Pin-like site-specific DNA recombinase